MTIEISEVDQKFDKLCILLQNKQNNSINVEFNLVNEIANLGLDGFEKLLSLLLKKYTDGRQSMSLIDEYVYELLLTSEDTKIINLLKNNLPNEFIALTSELNIDYKPLQILLRNREFQEADQLTQYLLCKLSQNINNHSRSWLYFTDIPSLPSTDLRTIDKLWQVHSVGLFGISVQRDIWLNNSSNWEKFWEKIGWTVNNLSRRYPQEFIWDVTAPAGHLPLFNQLRGVQVLDALFAHPAWHD